MVSVVIPTFNRIGTIARAIDSVLAQTYQDIEIIIADDGSTDGTCESLSRYGTRIKMIKQPNRGPSAARNLGASVASGDTLSFLDSDDTWHPEKLRKQMLVLEMAGDSIPCCICNSTLESHSGKSMTSFAAAGIPTGAPCGLIHNPSQLLASRFLLFNQVVTVRRDVFERIGGFNEHLWLLEDHDLALRLSIQGAWGFVSDPLVAKHESEGNLGGNARANPINHLRAVVNVLDGFLARGDLSPWLRSEVSDERGRILSAISAHELAANPSLPISFAGRGWLVGRRIQSAIRRRSPWWPSPCITPLNAS